MKKQIIVLGLPSPIIKTSKRQIISDIYKRVRKNSFIHTMSFDEYRNFLVRQIENSGHKVSGLSPEDLYDTLKRIGWLKEFNMVLFSLITIRGLS